MLLCARRAEKTPQPFRMGASPLASPLPHAAVTDAPAARRQTARERVSEWRPRRQTVQRSPDAPTCAINMPMPRVQVLCKHAGVVVLLVCMQCTASSAAKHAEVTEKGGAYTYVQQACGLAPKALTG
jgi:hypothetical protein